MAPEAGPYAAIAEAMTVGFLKDIRSAVAVLRRAEARYPGDPTLPAVRARFAMLIDDRAQVKEAIDRSLSARPGRFQRAHRARDLQIRH